MPEMRIDDAVGYALQDLAVSQWPERAGAGELMLGYAHTDVFDRRVQRYYTTAFKFVSAIPEKIPDGRTVRCHELTRATLAYLRLHLAHIDVDRPLRMTFEDGKFKVVDHSWICFPEQRCILDVYAVGRLPMVQLVTIDVGYLRDYVPSEEKRGDIDASMVSLLLRLGEEALGTSKNKKKEESGNG